MKVGDLVKMRSQHCNNRDRLAVVVELADDVVGMRYVDTQDFAISTVAALKIVSEGS